MVRTASRRAVLQAIGAAAGLGATGTLAACTTPATGTPVTSAAPPAPSASTSPAGPTPTAPRPLRFLTASDGHLGEPGTDSRRFLTDFVAAANRFQAATPVDFAVINGDIGHGGVALLTEAKAGLDRLSMPYYVTQGNHDEVDDAEWEGVWGTPGNQVLRFGARSLVLANTSNKAGDYLCADLGWLKRTLASEAGQQDVLVVMHITPNTWTKHGIACPDVRRLLGRTPNVRAVFNGHDHDEAGMKTDDGVPYFFDAHYGGHWGTSYRAFRVVEVGAGRLDTHLVTLSGEQRGSVALTW
jgi:hypothetical protein